MQETMLKASSLSSILRFWQLLLSHLSNVRFIPLLKSRYRGFWRRMNSQFKDAESSKMRDDFSL